MPEKIRWPVYVVSKQIQSSVFHLHRAEGSPSFEWEDLQKILPGFFGQNKTGVVGWLCARNSVVVRVFEMALHGPGVLGGSA